jgi:hypothetical protein
MAKPDHTVLLRPPNPSGGSSSLASDGLPTAETDEEFLRRYRGTPNSASLALNTINRLLNDSDAYKRAQKAGLPVGPVQWPLPDAVSDGLYVALHHLCHYARTLGREPRERVS